MGDDGDMLLSPFFKYLGLMFLFASASLVFAWQNIPDGKLHMTFLDIGQGDSIFVVTPENHKILIDGGPKDNVLTELDAVMPYFDNNIDLLILTHPDSDHVDGFAQIIKRYKVHNILITGVENSNPSYHEFLKEISDQNINYIIAKADTDFKFGDVVFDVLYPLEPFEGRKFETPNDSSIVIKIFYKGNRILLTGDIEKKGELELIDAKIDLAAELLKVGHHGSKTSSTLEFLNLVDPDFAVIQSGKDNQFGHPSVQTLNNLMEVGIKKILRNDQLGRIEFVF